MQSSNYHELLRKQVDESLGNAWLSGEMKALLQAVSDSYTKLEADLKEAQATADKRTDQLIASTGRSYSFLDSIHKGFIMCDMSGEVVLTNNALRHILALKEVTEEKENEVQPLVGELSLGILENMLPVGYDSRR